MPKRTTLPLFEAKGPSEPKPLVKPKKFSAFSAEDSRRIEAQYQSLMEADEERRSKNKGAEAKSQRSASEPTNEDTRVPVNEDFLFDVGIERRELCPVYWLGPVYEGEYHLPATRPDVADLANASSSWNLVFPRWLKLETVRRKSCCTSRRSK